VGCAATLTALVLQGASGVFPAGPLPPLVTASGGAVVASGRTGAIQLNPASAAWARGVELSLVSHPRTDLEGFSAVLSTGARIGLVASIWSYALKDIFDSDLVALDPSLAGEGATSAGVSLGASWRMGPAGFGLVADHRMQSILDHQASASAVSVGARLDLKAVELGVAFLDVPLGSPHNNVSPRRTALAGVATTVRALRGVRVRAEIDAHATEGDFSRASYRAASTVALRQVEVTGGYSSWGWSAGAAATYERWRLEVASNFVSSDRLDQRVAFSIIYR